MLTLGELKARHFRHWELNSDWDLEHWQDACRHAVHFSSTDRNGNKVEGFYSPDEKLSSALIYRNFIGK